jgi:membrane-bound lytic murein transglycosylase B
MLGVVHTSSGSRSDSQTLSDQRLYAALKQIDRGVMSPSMHGEIGQTQFLPKNIQ